MEAADLCNAPEQSMQDILAGRGCGGVFSAMWYVVASFAWVYVVCGMGAWHAVAGADLALGVYRFVVDASSWLRFCENW